MKEANDNKNPGLPKRMLRALLILVPLCILIVDTTRPFRSTFRDLYNVHDLEKLFLNAASRLDIPQMERLLAAGVDVNVQGDHGWYVGWNALHCAVWNTYANTKALEFLIARGANVNAKNVSGFTPLFYCETVFSASVLLKNGVHVDARANKANGMITALFWMQNPDVAQLLISSGANVNMVSMWGDTPLCYATQRSDLRLVKVLIANGADVNANGGAPLREAALDGDVQFVAFLISKGANLEARNADGKTAMHYAALESISSRAAVVALFLSKGAQVNPVDETGKTPLDYATSDELKALLRKHGAKSGNELK
ncbi:MAG: ankyrin repeat domain-containing protein [Planctomycetota bacterium]